MSAYIIRSVSGGNSLTTLLVGIVLLLALLLVADFLVERRPFFGRPFRALVDSGVHGLVALLVTAPIPGVPQVRGNYWLWPSWQERWWTWITFSLPGRSAFRA